MPKQPRKHHYVPQFYLAGFTDNRTPDGRLYVLNTVERRQWPSAPKEAGHIRDFHRVNLGANVDPMAVEKKLSYVEGKQSVVLKKIVQEKALPLGDNEAMADLMLFVALMAVRTPRFRRKNAAFVDEAEKARLREAFATEEGRESFRRAIADTKAMLSPIKRTALEKLLNDDPDLSKTREYFNANEFTVSYGQTWHVQMMLRSTIGLLPCLSSRYWSLWIAQPNAPDLVCSDSPVALAWAKAAQGPWPPGFGLKNTVVTVPLDKRMALVGTFEPLPAKRTFGMSEVAAMNAATCSEAEQVFSAQEDFVWAMSDGEIGGKDDLLAMLQTDDHRKQATETAG